MDSKPNPSTRSVEGKARHLALGLKDKDLLEIYYKMTLCRALDERMWTLNRLGKALFVVSCRGHEAAQVGSAYALRWGEDFVVPYYRDLGVVLTVGMTPRDLMLSLLAKKGDPVSGGRQTPGHYSYQPLKIVSGSSPVATQIIHAVGIALASKIRKEKLVTIVYFGDGASSQGDFHEGLNFAGVHRLPVIFVCENNRYAISVPQNKQMAIENMADRAAAYGFPGVVVDGADVLAMYAATRAAVERARKGDGPTLMEAKVYRINPHSSDDDDRRYRSKEEVDSWKKKNDPLEVFARYLKGEKLLTDAQEKSIGERVAKEIDDATDFAEKSPYPEPEEAFTSVYHEGGA